MTKKNKKNIHRLKTQKKHTVTNSKEAIDKVNKRVDYYLNLINDKSSVVDKFIAAGLRSFHYYYNMSYRKKESISRVKLQNLADKYVTVIGAVTAVKEFHNVGTRIQISCPRLVGYFLSKPTMKELKTKIYDYPLEDSKEIDTHIWLDIDDITPISSLRNTDIYLGSEVLFVSKIHYYKGRVDNKVKRRDYKFGLEDTRIIDIGLVTEQTSTNNRIYNGKYSLTKFPLLKNYASLLIYQQNGKYIVNKKEKLSKFIRKNVESIDVEYLSKTEREYVLLWGLVLSLDEKLAKEVKPYIKQVPRKKSDFVKIAVKNEQDFSKLKNKYGDCLIEESNISSQYNYLREIPNYKEFEKSFKNILTENLETFFYVSIFTEDNSVIISEEIVDI